MDKVSEYDKYDNLWIATPENPEKTVMGIGVQAQLWITDGHTDAKRRTMLEAMGDYVGMFPAECAQFKRSGSTGGSKLKGDNWHRYYDDLIQKTDPAKDGFTPSIEGDDYINHHFAWGFGRVAREDIDDTLSYWAASVRPSWVKDHTANYVAAVMRWATILQPVHGTCGLAPVFEIGMDRTYAEAYWPFVARFPCLDLFTALDLCAGASDGVRGVSWLTILSDAYVERLGGLASIEAELHELSTMHPYDGGVVIQACPEPQIGDVSLDNFPAPYVAVNELVRPHRFEDYPERPMCLIKVPDPLDAFQETMDWVRRFDGKG